MDRVGRGDLGGADDRGNMQVALRGRRRPDAPRLVGEAHVQRARVGLRVHGDRLDAELAARANDAQRDLAAIGDEDLLKHRATLRGKKLGGKFQAFLMRKSFWPNSTAFPFCAKIATIVPECSASISFISFIASMMQSVCPARTTEPTSTNDGVSGLAAR